MTPNKPDRVPAAMWRELASGRGAWRTPVLANVTESGLADARVVVLREISREKREVAFFTDRRSNKYPALQARPSVCLVIHDIDAGWQVRLHGRAREETSGPELDACWNTLGAGQRAHYAPDTDANTAEKGRENFAAFRVVIEWFHCLWLHEDGNEAAEYRWHDNDWQEHSVRP